MECTPFRTKRVKKHFQIQIKIKEMLNKSKKVVKHLVV
jgi:hypothetical protein